MSECFRNIEVVCGSTVAALTLMSTHQAKEERRKEWLTQEERRKVKVTDKSMCMYCMHVIKITV